MSLAIDLDAMSAEEKLGLIEAVWQSLSQPQESVPVPDWHVDVLKERERRLKSGESKLVDWNDAKRRLRDQFG